MGKNPANKRKGRKPKLDPELVAAALTKHDGNVAAVSRQFKVDRTSVRDLIDRRPSLQRVLADAREGMKDAVESALYAAASEGRQQFEKLLAENERLRSEATAARAELEKPVGTAPPPEPPHDKPHHGKGHHRKGDKGDPPAG